MTQMTTLEALDAAVSPLRADSSAPPAAVLDRLHTLGFTIVPITPTEERVEAAARALSVTLGWDESEWGDWTPEARNAYAAAIGEKRRD